MGVPSTRTLVKLELPPFRKNRGGAARKVPCGRQRCPVENSRKLRKGKRPWRSLMVFTGDYVGGRGGLLRGCWERIARLRRRWRRAVRGSRCRFSTRDSPEARVENEVRARGERFAREKAQADKRPPGRDSE